MNIKKNFYKRDTCRLCGSKSLENVLPLTPTALCDAYVPAGSANTAQPVFPLDLFLCRDCGFVFLPYVVNPEIIYRDYIYVTTSSLGLTEHFRAYSEAVLNKINPPEGALVIDIGSNDGTLLKFFNGLKMNVLGVEPAKEIARNATIAGIETLPEFFDCQLAERIKNKHGQATVVTINNLFANIDDLVSVVEGVRQLLSPQGVLVIESSYLADMIKNMVFDFIYHEHLSYFSIKPLISFFDRLGMEIFDVEHIATKGGSLRYYIQLKGANRPVSKTVTELQEYENNIGLGSKAIFKDFSDRIAHKKSQLLEKLCQVSAQGKTIAGYGGSATTTTFLYHFDLSKFINYIVDDNSAKHNTLSPGFHIPVLPVDIIYERRPDYILVIAWRYFDAIIRKHELYIQKGGSFIRPLPELEIIGGRDV